MRQINSIRKLIIIKFPFHGPLQTLIKQIKSGGYNSVQEIPNKIQTKFRQNSKTWLDFIKIRIEPCEWVTKVNAAKVDTDDDDDDGSETQCEWINRRINVWTKIL